MNRAASAVCAAILVVAAGYYPLFVIRPGAVRAYGMGAHDIYAYFYPNIRYALDGLARGDGLLWNPFQSCGQPFFAISQTGLLYPVNWVFALLPREAALLTNMFLNLAIAGLGGWWLGREMGLSRPAALVGGLASVYSVSALYLATWSPIHLGAYAWMPVALAALERLLRAPSPRRSALLGVVLTLQLLPGFPQLSLFTYEVIALRVAWELATARVPRRAALVGYVALGLALPPLLAAVQFLPALVVAHDSVRALPLQRGEIGTGMRLAGIRAAIGQEIFLQGALTITALAVAGLGLTQRATRRLTGLYLFIVAISVLIALGEATPAWWLYQRLPGGRTFRGPERFLWVSSFALAIACGLGVEGVSRRGPSRSRLSAALALAAGATVFAALPRHGVVRAELALFGAVVAAALATARWRHLAPAAGIVIGAALALNTLWVGRSMLSHRFGNLYDSHAALLERVRTRLTSNDRVLLVESRVGMQVDWGLTHKIASLFGLPSIYDYEPQGSLRYAQYFAFMRTGRPLTAVYDWYAIGGLLLPSLQRPLFDLTAARYVVVDESADKTAAALGDTAPEILRDGPVRVYENRQALPRALVVPDMARVPDDQVLPMLASGRVDPRRVALVGVRDATAWSGTTAAAAGGGRATIVRDDPQTVAVDVQADAPGFLFLADQYDPGWTAAVDGVPAEILRANHAFRLVAVPGGRSQVVFRYRPRAVRIGAAISLVSALLIVLCLLRGGRADHPDRVAVPADTAAP